MIQGRSWPETPAGFIGAAARKANRLRQIQELERAHMPTAEELDQALALLEQARRALQLAEEEEERRASAAQETKKAGQRWSKRFLSEARDFPMGLKFSLDWKEKKAERPAPCCWRWTRPSPVWTIRTSARCLT